MKRLLPLFTALFLAAMLHGQTLKIDGKKFKEDAAYRESVSNFFDQEKSSTDTVGITHPRAYLVHPKPGIHRLPQDNMPCVVPDTRLSVAIPNLWAGKVEVPFKNKPPRIPNPAKPFKLSPSRPLLTQPDNDSNAK